MSNETNTPYPSLCEDASVGGGGGVILYVQG